MKRIVLVAGLALITMSVNAQLLWKVTSPKSEKTSYIVGTHHIAPPTMINDIKGLTDAIDKVEKVIGEVDMTNLNQMEIQQATLPYLMAPADSTLSKVFTAEQLDSIGNLLGSYTGGMVQIAQLEMMKPIAVGQTIALLQSQKAFPTFDPTQQLDSRIQAIAKAGGKATAGLETIEFQLKTLYGTPISKQAEDLLETVRNDSIAIIDSQRLADAYVAGNIDEIDKMMREGRSALDSETRERLLLSRNADWAEKLNVILTREAVLVAVGCGHLPGEKGLISLLREKGFTVEPAE
ncbi:MAG: TraB/GumN family protein [Paramuribaculum sp.]|nr:TraB/GumN family protein [Paramuribaculum sp.]